MSDEDKTTPITYLFDTKFPELKNKIFIGCGINQLKKDILDNCVNKKEHEAYKQKVREAIKKILINNPKGGINKSLDEYQLELKKELGL